MKIQLLPSSFDSAGRASLEQRLTCFLIDDLVAIDGGSLGISANVQQRKAVRDIVVTHPHIDHIASLPIFVDDLFSELREPVRIHAMQEVIDILERDLFNWLLYPRFSELTNAYGRVLEFIPMKEGETSSIAHLKIMPVPVNHHVPTVGLIVSDGKSTVAFSADTARTEEIWRVINSNGRLSALFIEASFPDSMHELAEASYHLTPRTMNEELSKLNNREMDIFAVHLKPSFRDIVARELRDLGNPKLRVMDPGIIYEV